MPIGQLGNGTNSNTNYAVEVQGLSDIIKVEAYQNITIALDKEGKVYTWGESYSTLPMRLISSKKMVDVSGKIFLSEEGFIYEISNLENRLNNLSQIAKISAGTDHYLALSVHGYVYSWGVNNVYGELGKTSLYLTSAVTKDAYEIIAGNDTSFVKTEEDEVYVSRK